jgi:hypothetical protein
MHKERYSSGLYGDICRGLWGAMAGDEGWEMRDPVGHELGGWGEARTEGQERPYMEITRHRRVITLYVPSFKVK